MKIIELFSGIGGFTKGFEDAGYTIEEHYFSEIDKHAIANYKYNYPNAKYIGSVIDINGENYSSCNILTFGFPCQDLSLAGKRLGFKGKRSSLFYHAARILREGQIETFIWENVMGLLSSNKGDDIQSVCEELYLSGYVFDFEEQNTKWYLPQNRRRIYCIGHNIKKMHKWIISEQNGQNQKYFLYRKIIKSWVLNKYQKYLTEVLSQLEQRQKELVLEFYFQKEQKMLNGVNLKKRLSEIINSLPFENWKYCYQTVLELLLKQCDINSDALIVQNLNSLQEVINTCGTKEEMEKRKSFLSIEKLLKMLLEENLKAVNKSIILTLINSTTKLKTFTYAKMQLNIELFIIQLSLLYPNCWKEELSDLIETQRNTNYAKIRENEIRNFKKNNNAPVQLSIFEEIGDDTNRHLADRSEPGVFPIGENDEWINERAIETRSIRTLTAGGNSGGLHSSMSLIKVVGKISESQDGQIFDTDGISQCLSAGHGNVPKIQVKSATKNGFEVAENGDSINLSNPNSKTRRGRVGKGVAQTLDCACNQAVMIGAFRGRNPENPKSRESGLPTEQMLEINKAGVSNTLTSVQKDNVVLQIRDGRDNRSCLRSGRVSELGYKGNSIRRLTEIECERLQGFPQQKIFICLEKIKNHAQNAEVKCRKLQKFVLTAEKTDLNLNALFANQNLNTKQVQKNKLVLENVHINFGENAVEIHNQGKLIFCAKNAESKNWFHPLIKIEDFVLLIVRTNLIPEKEILIGKEEFRVKEQSLTHQKNSRKLVKEYGKETTLLANDAEKDLIILSLLLKFTTSSHLNTKKADVILKTWFSFVIRVINGFIPEEIQIVNLSNLSLSIDSGWTEYGNYDGTIKKIPKTQRYKMLGNAVTVKVVEEIAKRLNL